MSETPVRNIRIDNDMWAKINEAAAENGETAASFIRRAVVRALKEQEG